MKSVPVAPGMAEEERAVAVLESQLVSDVGQKGEDGQQANGADDEWNGPFWDDSKLIDRGCGVLIFLNGLVCQRFACRFSIAFL